MTSKQCNKKEKKKLTIVLISFKPAENIRPIEENSHDISHLIFISWIP
jgi:hypothetical protein